MILVRKRAIFDFHFHHLTDARSNRDVAIMKDQATSARFLSVRITRTRCGMLLFNVPDSVRMSNVSKVITVPVGGRDPVWGGDSVAV